MRLLMVAESFDPGRGGAERSLGELAQALRRLGLVVDILANESPLEEPWLHLLQGPKVSRSRGLAAFAAQAQAWIEAGDYDLVHSITPAVAGQVYQPRAGCLPALFRASLGRASNPVVRAARRFFLGLNAKRQALLRMERAVAENSSALICPISRLSAQDFLTHYRIDPDRVRVVPNAVDLRPLAPEDRLNRRAAQREVWGIGAEEKVLLFAGHDFRRKGLDVAIAALNLAVLHQGLPWRLVVLGQDDVGPFRRLAQRLGLAERVIWAGRAESAAAAMTGADLLALPAFFEPSGRVVLEALILGLPVAVSPLCGAAEAVTPGEDGFTLDSPGDAAGLARAMARLMDQNKAARMAQAGQAKAGYLHTDRMARELVPIYEEILARLARDSV